LVSGSPAAGGGRQFALWRLAEKHGGIRRIITASRAGLSKAAALLPQSKSKKSQKSCKELLGTGEKGIEPPSHAMNRLPAFLSCLIPKAPLSLLLPGLPLLAAGLWTSPTHGAGVIVGPVAVTDPPGVTTFSFANTINQSGLSVGYTSGVTDFDTYIALRPTQSGNNSIIGHTEQNPPVNIDYDLGASYPLLRLAFWNNRFSGASGVRSMEIRTSQTADFSLTFLAGTLSPDDDTANLQVFNLAASTARYVRVRVVSRAGPNGSGTAFGEIAFGTAETPSLVVTTTSDSSTNTDGQTSLREAVGYAATLNGPQTVTFSNTTANGAVNFSDGTARTITLAQGELGITGNASLTINGTGADRLSVSGNNASRVFFVGPQANLTLNNLTVTGGRVDGSNGNAGAGIYNNGTMTLTNCVVSGNSAPNNGLGAGITNSIGSLTVINSTISGNSVTGGIGGGILNDVGMVKITGSTISGNSAIGNGSNSSINGGGLFNISGTVTLTNSTISGNFVRDGATNVGGGLFNSGTVSLVNSTVSGNSASGGEGGIGGGIYSSGTTSALNTIVSGNSADFGPDLSGSLSGASLNNLVGGDAMLAPLAGNGGPTSTHALLPGSPAIDAGDNSLIPLDPATNQPLTTDQRGFLRTQKGNAASPAARVDIGAYEFIGVPTFTVANLNLVTGGSAIDLAAGASPSGGTFSATGAAAGAINGTTFNPAGLALGVYTITYTIGDGFGVSNSATFTVTVTETPSLVVTTTADVVDPLDNQTSLREAVAFANSNPGDDTITFDATVFASAQTITLDGTQLDLANNGKLTITGPAAGIVIDAAQQSRVFNVASGANVTLDGLTISNGRVFGDFSSANFGGGIFNNGTLTITNSTLSNNSASGSHSHNLGGGIYNIGTLTITNSTLSNNSASGSTSHNLGGGIYNIGTLTITNSTLSNNSVSSSGSGNNLGGGIFNNGTLTITNSTLSANSVSSDSVSLNFGGGIYNSGTLTITNSTLSNNSVSSSGIGSLDLGGGVYNSGTLTITNSTLSNNSASGSSSHNLGGGIYNDGSLNIGNTILKKGTDGDNLSGTVNSLGANLSDDGTGPNNGTTDRLNTDPLLGPLADNGGPTRTHALLIGSPAIDAGNPAFDPNAFTPPLTNDQRGTGFDRVTKGVASSPAARIDIGAYELTAAPVFTDDDLSLNTGSAPLNLTAASGMTPLGGTFSGTGVSGGFFDPTGLSLGVYTVTYTVGDGNGTNSTDLTVTVTEAPSLTVTTADDDIDNLDGFTSLREALAYATTLTGAQTVDFSATTAGGSVNFYDGTSRTITLAGTELEVTGSVTVDGPGAEWLTISANSFSRVLHLPAAGPTDEVLISGLTIADGYAFDGGGLYLSGASVTITECVIRDNVVLNSGAGFFKDAGSLVMTDCLVIDNFVDGLGTGAGAFSTGAGSTVIRRTTISGNTGGNFGGGFALGGIIEISDSLVEGNSATFGTGGLGVAAAASVTITNSTISGNTASSGDGGGISNSGTLTVIQSTIAGNTTAGSGGGLANLSGTTTLSNSLIAGNNGSAASPDLSGAFTDVGGNLIGNGDGGTGFTTSTLIGTTVAPIDPLIAPLAVNGGPTFTHALLIGSPAIDAGENALALDAGSASLTSDQRGAGFDRIVKGLSTSAVATVDIGAYELFAAPVFVKDQLSVVTGGRPLNLALESGAVPGGGTFSGPGVSGGLFDPGALAPGDYLVTYTVVDGFGIANASTLTVTVRNLPASLSAERPKPFKPTQVGRKGGTQRVRITNTGGLPLTGLSVRLSGPHRKDFRLVKPSASTLQPASSTVYRLTFKPRVGGVRKATITVTGGGEVSTSPVRGVGQKDGTPLNPRYPTPRN